MPDLNVDFNPDVEEDEDAAEEKNLMTILLKLKTAKSSLDASRKRYIQSFLWRGVLISWQDFASPNRAEHSLRRKHYQQNIDDAYAAVSKENKEQLNKHKKRWSAKISQVYWKKHYKTVMLWLVFLALKF